MTALSEAQKRALATFADGRCKTASEAAEECGIAWPASGNFGTVVRGLMKLGLLGFDSPNGTYRLTPAGRTALQEGGRK